MDMFKKIKLLDWYETKKKSIFIEYMEAIFVAFVLAMLLRTFVVQAFKIPSGSMIPTLQIGDHILVNKFIYWFTKPQRGNLIVFQYPNDPSRDFIKRVIGLPGETIEVRHRQVYINGRPLKEDYPIFTEKALNYREVPRRDNFGPMKIPPSSYFMMGDNRDNSMDSRFWGPLDEKLIKGRAFMIYWSIAPDENDYSNGSILENIKKYFLSLGKRIKWSRIGTLIH